MFALSRSCPNNADIFLGLPVCLQEFECDTTYLELICSHFEVAPVNNPIAPETGMSSLAWGLPPLAADMDTTALLSVRATKKVLYFKSMLVVLRDASQKSKKYAYAQLRQA